MYQVESSESLEGVFRGGLINRGKNVLKRFDSLYKLWGGGGQDRGAGARENRGREGYGRRERKGREAGVLIGREAGEKCGTLMFFYSTMRWNTFKNKNPKYI